jgi:hypothetical protein
MNTLQLHQHHFNVLRFFFTKVNEAKAKWIKKRESQQRVELYLVLNDFDSELKRFCTNFYSELKKNSWLQSIEVVLHT